MKIACWSGPRNLSTAMMYSFANRADFTVMDEPFYGPFLRETGLPHPMASQVIAAHGSDWEEAAASCAVEGRPHVYQKHMCHHILEQTPLGWAEDCRHVFLIRHPARVLASYQAKREEVTLDDIGVEQQIDLYEELGGIVIDSADIRDNPEAMLRALCAALDLDFDPAMLSWPAGGIAEDGIWAQHWYNAVHKSTGFAGPEGPLPDLSGPLAELCEDALPAYAILRTQRLKPG
ncbi:HAD family hydrolase [uncultured Litoreibacter sp.]|uniref:sulfotransferase-like domain-containing protein n=1 Tax=uncultured Litoreibacter sp. TaxID=1392394 RepID=UPI00260D2021|nr:HAD family hydrolase [uncultured Litoreibacter sp.]